MKQGGRAAKMLFYGVVLPVGFAARPLWRRRLGLKTGARARTYWRTRGDVVDAKALRGQR